MKKAILPRFGGKIAHEVAVPDLGAVLVEPVLGGADGGVMERLILVVDDAAEAREMCTLFLSQEGYRVAVASDGQEAVEKAARLLPALILMDLSLPVMGGLEATKRIKSDPRTQHIPVVLLTGQVRSGPAAVIEAGCEGFLVKPAAPKDIVAEIERVLKRARIQT